MFKLKVWMLGLLSLVMTTTNAESIRVYPEAELSRLYDSAAQEVIDTIKANPQAVIILPTGATPEKMYSAIVAKFKRDPSIDLSKAQFFNLDEYVDLSEEHPLSYRYYMNKLFYEPLTEIDAKRAPTLAHQHIPGVAKNQMPKQVLADYEKALNEAIRNNPRMIIDLAVLGVGGAYPFKTPSGDVELRGGHIGFNEPGSKASQPSHVATLTEKTKLDTKFRFSSLDNLIKTKAIQVQSQKPLRTTVPDYALTLGLNRILSAKKIMVLATGEDKATVIDHVFNYPTSTLFPASYIKNHSNVIWVLDEFAASPLQDKKPKKLDRNKVAQLSENADASKLPQQHRVLIVSPHPDDDVISMGATIYKLLERKNEVKVIYVVSGSNSVRTSEPVYKAQFEKLKDEGQAKAKVREVEATQATSRLGLKPDNLIFFNAQYYQRRGVPGVSPLIDAEIERMKQVLESYKPQDIYFAAENDPHGAHGLSTQLLAKAIASSNLKDVKFHGYRGAYNEWDLSSPEELTVVLFDQKLHDLKALAIKDHASQLDPMFPSFDPRPFYQRASDRNRNSAELFYTYISAPEVVKLANPYVEAFKNFNQSDFVKRYQ